jgi:hypothetical protein
MDRGARESFQGKTTVAVGKMTTRDGSGISAPKRRRSRALKRWQGRGLQRKNVDWANLQAQRPRISRVLNGLKQPWPRYDGSAGITCKSLPTMG